MVLQRSKRSKKISLGIAVGVQPCCLVTYAGRMPHRYERQVHTVNKQRPTAAPPLNRIAAPYPAICSARHGTIVSFIGHAGRSSLEFFPCLNPT